MSAFSTIYDAVDSLVSTALPSYTKAPKSIILEENPNLLMNSGYIISWGDGQNTNRFASCKLSISRIFTISLMNKVVSLETNATQLATQEKNMFNDQLTLVRAIENDVTLGGTAVRSVYSSDGGIEFLAGDRINYYLLQTDLEIEYIENL